MTNYELLCWLVEKWSHDINHYWMLIRVSDWQFNILSTVQQSKILNRHVAVILNGDVSAHQLGYVSLSDER